MIEIIIGIAGISVVALVLLNVLGVFDKLRKFWGKKRGFHYTDDEDDYTIFMKR